DRCVNLLHGHVQTVGDQWQILLEVILAFAEKEAADGRIVVDDDAAFAVEDAAARREHRHLADAVLFGEHAIVGGAEHLQTPEAGAEHQHHQRNHVLHAVELDRRQLLAAAERVRIVVVEDHLRVLSSLTAWCVGCCGFSVYSRILKRSSRRKTGMATTAFTIAQMSSWTGCRWTLGSAKSRLVMRYNMPLWTRLKPKFSRTRLIILSTSTAKPMLAAM